MIKFQNLKQQIIKRPNLEAALLGPGFLGYFFYRTRFYFFSILFFYFSFFIKNNFLGSDYSNFYTSQMAQLEQFVFWVTQVIWLFILSNEFKVNQFIFKKNKRNYLKLSFPISILLCFIFGVYLYSKGLLVFTYLSVYGLVSVIFLFQILSFIILKTLHATVYNSKRIYVNIWLIYSVHFLSIYLLLYFWNSYNYWSIPISFGFQIIGLVFVRGFYYLKEYKLFFKRQHILKQTYVQLIQSLNWRFFFFALIYILPDITLYSSVQFIFFKKASYSFIFYFLAALTNSRIPSLFFQDFLKYSSEKYNLVLDLYEKRLSRMFLITSAVLHLLFLLSKYLLFGYISYKLALLSLILCLSMTAFGTQAMRRFTQLRLYDLLFQSFVLSTSLYCSVWLLQIRYYGFSLMTCLLGWGLIWLFHKRTFFLKKKTAQLITSQEAYNFYENDYSQSNLTTFRLDGLSIKHAYFQNFLLQNELKIQIVYKNKNNLIRILHNEKLEISTLFPFIKELKVIQKKCAEKNIDVVKSKNVFDPFRLLLNRIEIIENRRFTFSSDIQFSMSDLKLIFCRCFKGHKNSLQSFVNSSPILLATDWHQESIEKIHISVLKK